jgi:MFS superfamily sulfate permease-like transporter
VALSAGNLLLTFSKLDTNLETNEDGSKSHLEIQGAATFLSLPKIAAKLEQVPRGSELHMNSVRLSYIDHACLELIATWSRQHVNLGGKSLIDWNQLNARFSTGPAPVIAPTDEQAPKDPVYGKEE